MVSSGFARWLVAATSCRCRIALFVAVAALPPPRSGPGSIGTGESAHRHAALSPDRLRSRSRNCDPPALIVSPTAVAADEGVRTARSAARVALWRIPAVGERHLGTPQFQRHDRTNRWSRTAERVFGGARGVARSLYRRTPRCRSCPRRRRPRCRASEQHVGALRGDVPGSKCLLRHVARGRRGGGGEGERRTGGAGAALRPGPRCCRHGDPFRRPARTAASHHQPPVARRRDGYAADLPPTSSAGSSAPMVRWRASAPNRSIRARSPSADSEIVQLVISASPRRAGRPGRSARQ